MSAQVGQSRTSNGLTTLWNLIVAPSAAFAALREQPTWLIAFIIVAVASIVSSIVMQPAVAHALSVSLPTQFAQDPRYASMTADERARALAITLGLVRFGWIFNVVATLITVLFAGLVLWVTAIIARGEASFPRSFALAMNVAVIWLALGQLVAAGIVAGRGPDSFNAPYELSFAVPNLGWLTPGAAPKVLGFLAGINPFSVWAFFLTGAGMAAIARIRPIAGYLAAAVLILCGCGLLAMGVR